MRLYFRTFVARLAFTDFSVFDGFHRTATDTCHAVGAVFTPYWRAVLYRDIIHWAEIFTKSAAGTAFCCAELLRLDIKTIEEDVDRTTFDLVF